MRTLARPLALLLVCVLPGMADVARAQVPPDVLLRDLSSEQRESLWNSMTPQQRREFWQQLTPDQRQAIRSGMMSHSMPRPGPMMGGGGGPHRRWQMPGSPADATGAPPDALDAPSMPRRWSPQERQKLREQIREWNRDVPGPHGGHRPMPEREPDVEVGRPRGR